MEEEERGPRLSKRFSDKGGEVDYKTKAGTAWSHSYLNQKPWHPLSYPNQRRKWIAEQTHSQRQRRAEEVAREYAQEQEFLRQTSLLSQKEKEKVDMMQAVSFMYVRPPGYNAESAKAAEVADEEKRTGKGDPAGASSSAGPQEAALVKEEKRKPRPKDVFGRSLPTEEEFAVLKNAPRLETGAPARVKPFAVEVRNVKCVRCGSFGHQSGDRECPLKDAIMPNDESRLKRDDPLTAILAHMETSEPLKWELKQKPGISPPRGGFMPNDPNQQIVAEDIFDEYGGFLSGGSIPDLLSNFSTKKSKRKLKSNRKHKKEATRIQCREDKDFVSGSDDEQRSSKTKLRSDGKHKQMSPKHSDEESDSSSDSEAYRRSSGKIKRLHESQKKKGYSSDSSMSEDSDNERLCRKSRRKIPCQFEPRDFDNPGSGKHGKSSGFERKSRGKEKRHRTDRSHKKSNNDSKISSSEKSDRDSERHYRKSRQRHLETQLRVSYEDGLSDGKRKAMRKERVHNRDKSSPHDSGFGSSDNSEFERRSDKRRHKHSLSSESHDSDDTNHMKSSSRKLHRHRNHHSDSRSYK